MLSKSSKLPFKCLSCATDFEITHWFKVDGKYEPQLKAAILDDSIFVVCCPKCSAKYRLNQSIRYCEFRSDGTNFHAYLIDPADIPKQREYIEMLPLHRMNGSRIHVVTSSGELQQLIRAYDSGGLPPETIIRVSDDDQKNVQHDESLKRVKATMDGFQKELLSGKLSSKTIETIKSGRKKALGMSIWKAARIAAAAMLFLALFEMPDEYYKALRFVVTAAAIMEIYQMQRGNFSQGMKTAWTLAFAGVAIVFNPFLPLEMEREAWAVFDVMGSGLFGFWLVPQKVWDELKRRYGTGERLPPPLPEDDAKKK